MSCLWVLVVLLAACARSQPRFNLNPTITNRSPLPPGTSFQVDSLLTTTTDAFNENNAQWSIVERKLCALSVEANLHGVVNLTATVSGSQFMSIVINMANRFDGFYLRANGGIALKLRKDGLDLFVFTNADDVFYTTGTPNSARNFTSIPWTPQFKVLNGTNRFDIAMTWSGATLAVPSSANIAVNVTKLYDVSTGTRSSGSATTTTTSSPSSTPMPLPPLSIANLSLGVTSGQYGAKAVAASRRFAFLGQYHSNFCINNWSIYGAVVQPATNATTTRTTTTTATTKSPVVTSSSTHPPVEFQTVTNGEPTSTWSSSTTSTTVVPSTTDAMTTTAAATMATTTATATSGAAVVNDSEPATSGEMSSLPLILGLVFGVLLAIMLLIAAVLLVRRHRAEKTRSAARSSGASATTGATPSSPAPSAIYGQSSFSVLE